MTQKDDSTHICIIGAGASGIVAAKILHQRQIPFVAYEKGSQIGGLWRYNNDNGLSAAYATLHINTSRQRMAYSDFPMPDNYPVYPHHSQIIDYFDAYVDHFGFRDHIRFNTEVTRVTPDGQGGWRVRLADGSEHGYRAVIVANGHHWDPRWPDFPGSFSGRTMHSHDYRTPNPFDGARVLIVGIGNSAVDIAVDVCGTARRTIVSTRRSAYIVPKYMFGKPADEFTSPVTSRLPLSLQRLGYKLILWLSRGSQENYGVPVPKHKLLQEHPTVSSDFLLRAGHGDIEIKPNIAELQGDRVRFVDGTEAEVDTIIYCTGYNISFPFFPPEVLTVENNELPLYRRVVHPELPGIYFIGFLQPLGAVMPLAELQSQWVADLLQGRCALPDRDAMWQAIRKERRRMARRYVSSSRHTVQIDFFPYIHQIKREIKRGRRRAKRKT